MKFHLETLGCQMNLSDGERVTAVFEEMGYQWTDKEEDAQVIGILACSVRQKAIDKVYSRIHKWNKWKNHKNLITFISGCILPSDKEKFLNLFDIVFQMSELPKLPEIISQYGIVTPASLNTNFAFKVNNNLSTFWHIEPNYKSAYEAFVPIQNGCDKFCTFCAVPYTRGREVSRPSQEILDEVKYLIDHNYKSITILGQNVNSYGLDKKGDELSFAQLLEEIGKMGDASGKKFWVYFTSPHPRDMQADVFHVMARYKCLAKQVHLPVQSGDDKVLIKMNRKHSVEEYRKLVNEIKKVIPQATLFTDIIVGFTGETDEQFENTRAILKEFQYNMAYIAMYSPRPGAVSSRWQDDIPLDIKKQRLHQLSEDLKQVSETYNKSLEGKSVDVLITGKHRREGYMTGLTEGKINVQIKEDDPGMIGSIVTVKVTSSRAFSIEGELINALIAG
ncbi:tRNA (N6-isopentenyl adenosine(37)-C2)-methylthiotransferase MiaB [Saccharicrinis sp. FJH54]|uniref:tRNA (N6-isopentenyl adenosine(37)-C2)-methylthiotransferase MiaB n=1 Tax=Saccharicrinis sp. FJH54 TaxID=3344665 RepID=UPI0035D496A2